MKETYQPPQTAIVQTDTFLSAEELYDLTGYRSPKKQCEHLRTQGIAFLINARGYPRVSRTTIEQSDKVAKHKPQKTWQPKVQAA
ncbi:DUF4224 domain-containing protein [Wielerella bovis]|uniref:DUF4224 domain-containing protein n=1 Tax=Wielerella bovis TaxID=2917790 RepID=UPI00201944DA|nr:DUF4224 domain-containing protein [Wielerella bovis]ULJ60824.1 DUF4224 domain-containing protein [Wielerella bovis]